MLIYLVKNLCVCFCCIRLSLELILSTMCYLFCGSESRGVVYKTEILLQVMRFVKSCDGLRANRSETMSTTTTPSDLN